MQYRKISFIAAKQDGVVTLDQLRELASSEQIKTMRANGVILRVQPRVYAMAGSPSGFNRCSRAALLSAPGSALSHWSAALLWDIAPNYLFDGIVDLSLVRTKRATLTNVRLHRTKAFGKLRSRDGMLITTPERTFIDLACSLYDSGRRQMLQLMLSRNLLTLRSLRAEVEHIGRSGRNGTGIVRELLEEIDPAEEKCASSFERIVRRELLTAGLPEPQAQFAVRPPGSTVRYIDFAYPELLLGIEVDSREYHTRLNDFENDWRRKDSLQEAGWTLFHVTSRNFDDCIARITRVFWALKRVA